MAHEHSLSIGYVALVDSAPLIVAREGGFFAEQGLQVDLQREPSWASLRDHLLFGDLVAAHALAPLPPDKVIVGAPGDRQGLGGASPLR